MAIRSKAAMAAANQVTGIGWANKEQACLYASISPRTLDKWLADGLKHSRIGGCLRIKYTEIDAYLERYTASDTSDTCTCSSMAAELLEGML